MLLVCAGFWVLQARKSLHCQLFPSTNASNVNVPQAFLRPLCPSESSLPQSRFLHSHVCSQSPSVCCQILPPAPQPKPFSCELEPKTYLSIWKALRHLNLLSEAKLDTSTLTHAPSPLSKLTNTLPLTHLRT